MSEQYSYPAFLKNKLSQFKIRFDGDWRGQHIMHGRTPNERSIKLTSNDYLAIANHPEIIKSQRNALACAENYLLMSGIFLHGDHPQLRFEHRMAEYMGADEIVLCQSGYNANTGLIQSIIADTDVPIYIDMLAHMSLWDGARITGSPVYAFRHNNVKHLLSLIEQHGPGLVMVDSVYSTNGSVCPLRQLINAVYEKQCITLVDESHSLGTHGPEGRGLVVALGLQNKVMFRTASLAKAFAGRAGLIACPKGFSEFFKFTSKPAIFSSTLLPHEVAGLNTALDLIESGDERRQHMHSNAKQLRQLLDKSGYNVSASQSQIIGLEAGSEWQTIVLRDALEKRGVFGSVFCPPATAKNRSLIRFSVNASLTDLDLKRISTACKEIVDDVGLLHWKSTTRRRPSHMVQSHNSEVYAS